jgi:hypothetical protein
MSAVAWPGFLGSGEGVGNTRGSLPHPALVDALSVQQVSAFATMFRRRRACGTELGRTGGRPMAERILLAYALVGHHGDLTGKELPMVADRPDFGRVRRAESSEPRSSATRRFRERLPIGSNGDSPVLRRQARSCSRSAIASTIPRGCRLRARREPRPRLPRVPERLLPAGSAYSVRRIP